MGILAWLVVGLIAGWLANMVMRGGRGNIVSDIIVGIIGAIVGGFLASQLFGVANPVNGINVGSIFWLPSLVPSWRTRSFVLGLVVPLFRTKSDTSK